MASGVHIHKREVVRNKQGILFRATVDILINLFGGAGTLSPHVQSEVPQEPGQ